MDNDELLDELSSRLDGDNGQALLEKVIQIVSGYEFDSPPPRIEAVLIPNEDGGIVIFDIDEFSESTNSLAASLIAGSLAVLDRDTHEWREVKKKGGRLSVIKGKQ